MDGACIAKNYVCSCTYYFLLNDSYPQYLQEFLTVLPDLNVNASLQSALHTILYIYDRSQQHDTYHVKTAFRAYTYVYIYILYIYIYTAVKVFV